MNASDFHTRILRPAAAFAASIHAPLDSPEARCLLLAAAGQETQWNARRQISGPARGFWQAEPAGVLAVLQNPATGRDLINAARAMCCGIDRASIYTAIEFCDPLAYIMARLLLRASPLPLPAVGDEDAAWAAYLDAQRPGKPDRERWAAVYPQAVGLFKSYSEITPPPPPPPQEGGASA